MPAWNERKDSKMLLRLITCCAILLCCAGCKPTAKSAATAPPNIVLINPLSPSSAPLQRRLQGPPAKSKFLAVIDGMTPLDMATFGNHNETADLLRKHGGKTGVELKAEGK